MSNEEHKVLKGLRFSDVNVQYAVVNNMMV